MQEVLEVKSWWEGGLAWTEAKDLLGCASSTLAQHFTSGKLTFSLFLITNTFFFIYYYHYYFTLYSALKLHVVVFYSDYSILDLDSCHLLDVLSSHFTHTHCNQSFLHAHNPDSGNTTEGWAYLALLWAWHCAKLTNSGRTSSGIDILVFQKLEALVSIVSHHQLS